MGIYEAVLHIMQTANPEEKQWATEVLSGKKSIESTTLAHQQPRKKFVLTPFDLGSYTPTREEIYEERTRQILGLDDDDE